MNVTDPEYEPTSNRDGKPNAGLQIVLYTDEPPEHGSNGLHSGSGLNSAKCRSSVHQPDI
jgi:hypothetical protein